MSGKVIDARAGDRWTKDRYGDIWQKRDNLVRWVLRDIHNKGAVGRWAADDGSVIGTPLPTPDAHAQLRAWGYEIRGDEVPTGRLAAPITEPPITESRVREILAQEIDRKTREIENFYDRRYDDLVSRVEKLEAKAKPTPSEIDEAVRIANDPETVWHNVTTMVVGPGFCGLVEEVPPEPDWRGLLDAVVKAVDQAMETGMCDEESWADLIADPALSSARTNLAAAGKAVGK